MENDVVKNGVHIIFGERKSSIEPLTGIGWNILYDAFEQWGKTSLSPDIWKKLSARTQPKDQPFIYRQCRPEKIFKKTPSTRQVVFGFTGPAGSGKTTAANTLEKYGFVTINVSAPMKRCAAYLFNVDVKNFEDLDFKSSVEPITGKTYRNILQTLGGPECFGKIDPGIWSKILTKNIETALRGGFPGVSVADVRKDIEIDHILGVEQTSPGTIARIIRITRTLDKDHGGGHASEKGVSPHLIHLSIPNDGSVNSLEERILSLARTYRSLEPVPRAWGINGHRREDRGDM